jgi:guanosine-3',5'-bis(diphosphate) 3'-pyrophosphohydrolase
LKYKAAPSTFIRFIKKWLPVNLEYEQVYDLLAFRSVWLTLFLIAMKFSGHIHTLFKPVPGRFKDYIAIPKANNYQSLHTTVIGPGAERIEIQIRTHRDASSRRARELLLTGNTKTAGKS